MAVVVSVISFHLFRNSSIVFEANKMHIDTPRDKTSLLSAGKSNIPFSGDLPQNNEISPVPPSQGPASSVKYSPRSQRRMSSTGCPRYDIRALVTAPKDDKIKASPRRRGSVLIETAQKREEHMLNKTTGKAEKLFKVTDKSLKNFERAMMGHFNNKDQHKKEMEDIVCELQSIDKQIDLLTPRYKTLCEELVQKEHMRKHLVLTMKQSHSKQGMLHNFQKTECLVAMQTNMEFLRRAALSARGVNPKHRKKGTQGDLRCAPNLRAGAALSEKRRQSALDLSIQDPAMLANLLTSR
jgi:hypothetical protein